ncbi:MAG TPA: serine/threonine-protein kinase [Lacipirellulaceae bacterium]|nr:serine/threonine-protein kinase [Lacipirellulaceae bacterium]
MAKIESFGHTNGHSSSIHGAETIIAPRPLLASEKESSGDSMREEARRGVALVEGSTPKLSAETRDLLRNRLRITAILFFVAFSAFLVRWFFHWSEWSGPAHISIFYVHGLVTVILGAFAVRLCRHCSYSLTKLRVAELVIFGCPALFFFVHGLKETVFFATLSTGARLEPIAIPWILLIFTYAIFIPNTWQRAAAVIGAMGIVPIAMLAYFYTIPAFNALAIQPEYAGFVSAQFLILAIVVMTALVGVQTIGTLRREAFAAKQLGQYRLKRRLGSGGMGEVYLAEHQMMKRPCAVKLIRPDKAGDPRMLARFEREVRATAKLSHWNSIDIYDYGRTADGTFYYVMEYLPGHNLGEIVAEYGPIPPARTLFLMDQVCGALAEAHGMGLVHRDIKPANIFCAYRGGVFDVVKLLDFGLAKPTMEKSQNAQLTLAGTITGSPLFMSPEQASGDDAVDARSDIYSLGAVMYYMLTGQPPFMSENPLKVMIAHASQEVVPPRQINPELPTELEEVVLRCLEKDPEHRFQDIASLRTALREIALDDAWSSDLAAQWWSCNGCPERKKLAAEVVEAAAV